jgi:hypothetical protein
LTDFILNCWGMDGQNAPQLPQAIFGGKLFEKMGQM